MFRSHTQEISNELADRLLELARDDAPVTLTYRGQVVTTLRPKADGPPLHEPEMLYTATERLIRIGHWEWDEVADRCIYCSPELARLHGITVDAFLRQACSTESEYGWVHPDDRPRYVAASGKLRDSGQGFDVEYRLLRGDGVSVPVREVANPVFGKGGRLERSFGFVQDLTNLVGDRQQLAAQTLLLRQVSDLADLGYWIWDEGEDRCAYCSDTMARMLGVSAEDYLQSYATVDQIVDGLHPDDRAPYLAALEKARRDQEAYRISYRVRLPDGGYRYLHDRGAPVLDANGQLVRWIGTAQDITDEKGVLEGLRVTTKDLEAQVAERTRDIQQAKDLLELEISEHEIARQALKESQSQLRAFIEISPMGIAIMDLAGRYLLVNPGIEKLFGLPAERLLGGTPRQHSREAFADQLEAQDRDVLARGQQDIREVSGVLNGETVTYLATKFVISDEAGEATALGLIAVDITEQKRIEASLRESEKRYRGLFEESPLPMLEEDWSQVKCLLDEVLDAGVTDLRAYFRDNPAFIEQAYMAAKSVGISKAAIQIYGAKNEGDLIDFMTWADSGLDTRKGYIEALVAFINGATSYGYEATERTLGIGRIKTRVKYVLPAGHRSDWSRVLVSIEDITAYRAAEERLRHAQKLEVVGQLTGGVAHDFNNLLAIIQGNAELLAERTANCENLINPIVHAAVRGGELTHGLLAFSRRQPLVPQSVDLVALMDGMLEILRRTLGETIEIGFSASPGLWHAMADPGQLESALLNLAINARDAMPDGGALRITCDNLTLIDAESGDGLELAVGDYVAVGVYDEGCGMTAQVRDRAFEPFFTTKEVRQGSGLGLSMVYGFAKQSGGQVVLDSEVGQGTRVKIYLPRAEPAHESVTVDGTDDVVLGAGELILVIEDDPDVRQLAARSLETMGYRVIAVEDATAARVVLAEGAAVSLLLSDVVLPGGTSGPAFAEELQAIYPSLPVIFMSGYPADEKGRDKLLRPEQVLLNKPFHRSVLAKALAEALK